jgi:hypothetical protein
VPNPEVPTALHDLVGVAHLRKRYRQSQRSGGLEIDERLNSGRLVNWQVNGFGALTGAFVFELRLTEWCDLPVAKRGASSFDASACEGSGVGAARSKRQSPSHGGHPP